MLVNSDHLSHYADLTFILDPCSSVNNAEIVEEK